MENQIKSVLHCCSEVTAIFLHKRISKTMLCLLLCCADLQQSCFRKTLQVCCSQQHLASCELYKASLLCYKVAACVNFLFELAVGQGESCQGHRHSEQRQDSYMPAARKQQASSGGGRAESA